MSKKQRRVAQKLVTLYYAHMFSKGAIRKHVGFKHHQLKLKQLTKGDRRHFMMAALRVMAVGAKPREYIIAQFQAFTEYGNAISKYITPMPHQLHSLGALARYQRYKGQQEMRDAREMPEEVGKRSFAQDEKRLAGLVRIHRSMPDDIIAEMPEEFSKPFLQERGVWKLVKDIWMERRAN